MILEGSLQNFSLADMMNMVGMSKKTGVLTVQGEEGTGKIYFLEGEPKASSVTGMSKEQKMTFTIEGEEAVYHLFTFTNCSFYFSSDASLNETQPIRLENTQLIMEGTRRLDEWRSLKELIPSLTHYTLVELKDTSVEAKRSERTTKEESQTEKLLAVLKEKGRTPFQEIVWETRMGELEVGE